MLHDVYLYLKPLAVVTLSLIVEEKEKPTFLNDIISSISSVLAHKHQSL